MMGSSRIHAITDGQQELKWKFVLQKPRIVNDLYALILIYFRLSAIYLKSSKINRPYREEF